MDALDLLVSMTKLQAIYSRFCQPVCRQFGLGHTELAVLLFLANHPQYNTARDVCEKRLIKKALVSVSVEKLVQMGYLVRSGDAGDRRVQRLEPTELAASCVQAGRGAQEAFYQAVTGKLTQAELAQYEAISQKLTASILDLSQAEAGGKGE